MTVIGDDIVESVMDDLLREATHGNSKSESLLGWLHQEHREHVKDMVDYAYAQLTLGEAGYYDQEKMRESLPDDPLADLDVQIVIAQIEQLR